MWKNVGYYNGEMGPLEEMKVPMNDRALYFGDGIYEATCVANRIPFAIEDHLDRMYNSLRLLEIPFKMERAQVRAELQKVIDAAEESPSTSCTGRYPGAWPPEPRVSRGGGGAHPDGLREAPHHEVHGQALQAHFPGGQPV